jgi:hypothetical protein
MKDRNKLCKYYIRAGVCSKGKGCTIWNEMQHCGLYNPDLNGKPLRIDNRKQEKEKIQRKEFKKGEW